MGGQPLNLIFGDPVAAEAHQYSLAAIPVGGGVTMSIVALIAVIVLTLIMASMVFKGVATRAVPMASTMVKGVVAKRVAVEMLGLITVVIIGLAVVNLIRMAVYAVGADLYTIRRAWAKTQAVSAHRPSVSLVVPMHNEGVIAERTLVQPDGGGLRTAADHRGGRRVDRRHRRADPPVSRWPTITNAASRP